MSYKVFTYLFMYDLLYEQYNSTHLPWFAFEI